MRPLAWLVFAAALTVPVCHLANAQEMQGVPAASGLLDNEECGGQGEAPCPQETAARPLLGPGDRAEPFVLADPAGEPVAFRPGEGGPVLLVFWSMFCPPCQEEMPYFADLDGKKGLRVITVNLDGQRMARAVENYARLNRIGAPIALDEKVQGTFVTAGAYGVTGTPAVFLVDASGTVRWSHQGKVVHEELEAEIGKLAAR
ncbi:TlpA family protein disulfide reductase [Deferrisoma sp.]